MLDRRQFLALATSLALSGRNGMAFGTNAFTFGYLPWGVGDEGTVIAALKRWAYELEVRTAVRVLPNPVRVNPSKLDEYSQLFLCLSGDKGFSVSNAKQLTQIRRFLARGGVLFIDSSVGNANNDFDRSVRRLLRQLSGKQSTNFEFVDKEHVVYKSFYLLDKPAGRLAVSGVLEGAELGAKQGKSGTWTPILYSRNHLLGALARDVNGRGLMQVVPGGERQRELATRLAINVAMYALCSDYKDDQVHVPFLLKRRNWRPSDDSVVIK